MDKYNKANNLKNIIDNIENVSDSTNNVLAWNISSVDDEYISLQIYSLEEQDFNIDIPHENDFEIFKENLYNCYLSFDVSTESYYWLDNSGHGKNGAPYEMIDVYNDMDWCKNSILTLYDELKKIA